MMSQWRKAAIELELIYSLQIRTYCLFERNDQLEKFLLSHWSEESWLSKIKSKKLHRLFIWQEDLTVEVIENSNLYKILSIW